MTLNTNFQIFDLTDKAVKDKSNRFIAEILMNHKGDALKCYELALKINKNDLIEIDTTDLNLIETAIKENQQYTNLIKGAILKEIECQKSIANKGK